MISIGIIGGSGLYDMAELTDRTEERITTPFGEPSAPYITGTLRGKLSRYCPPRRDTGPAYGTELPREHFGLMTLGVDSLGERRRLAERPVPAARHARARSVRRSDQGTRVDVFRTGPRRARWLRASLLPAPERHRLPGGAGRGSWCGHRRPVARARRAPGRHVWALKGPHSRPWPSRSCIARGGWTSSGCEPQEQSGSQAEICYTTSALITD